MRAVEADRIAVALGQPVLAADTLAGGFSHETCLLTLADGLAVARLGGPDPAIEAAIMDAAGQQVPVPGVLRVLPEVAGEHAARPAMILEHVAGTPLSQLLDSGHSDAALADAALAGLGAEVGRVAASIGAVTFGGPGFFTDEKLTAHLDQPWSGQLAEFAGSCMAATPPGRLDPGTRRAWAGLCAAHAPALARIDDQARLVHADMNPKNILVSRAGQDAWRVAAVLDWEFSFSGCPYADAANMVRFGADYPVAFLDAFTAAFAAHYPADLPPPEDWLYLGRVLDMFALSDLVTRSPGHPVADQAAAQIRRWVSEGVPSSPR